MATRSQAGS
jgi:hypothetical protein